MIYYCWNRFYEIENKHKIVKTIDVLVWISNSCRPLKCSMAVTNQTSWMWHIRDKRVFISALLMLRHVARGEWLELPSPLPHTGGYYGKMAIGYIINAIFGCYSPSHRVCTGILILNDKLDRSPWEHQDLISLATAAITTKQRTCSHCGIIIIIIISIINSTTISTTATTTTTMTSTTTTTTTNVGVIRHLVSLISSNWFSSV